VAIKLIDHSLALHRFVITPLHTKQKTAMASQLIIALKHNGSKFNLFKQRPSFSIQASSENKSLIMRSQMYLEWAPTGLNNDALLVK